MDSQDLKEIDAILLRLNSPLKEDDVKNGWSAESQKVAATYFETLKSAFISGSALPSLGIVRGLDHWGVTGGDLLEDLARVTNKLR